MIPSNKLRTYLRLETKGLELELYLRVVSLNLGLDLGLGYLDWRLDSGIKSKDTLLVLAKQ